MIWPMATWLKILCQIRWPVSANWHSNWDISTRRGSGFGAILAAVLPLQQRCSAIRTFFKVGIAESGNHDNRNYEDDWGERYDGLVTQSNYEAQANQVYAKNLKGKLLLAHGLLDDNVPPSNTMLVVEALIKANKISIWSFSRIQHMAMAAILLI